MQIHQVVQTNDGKQRERDITTQIFQLHFKHVMLHCLQAGCAWLSQVSTTTRSQKFGLRLTFESLLMLTMPTSSTKMSTKLLRNSRPLLVQVHRPPPPHNSLSHSIPPNNFYHTAHLLHAIPLINT